MTGRIVADPVEAAIPTAPQTTTPPPPATTVNPALISPSPQNNNNGMVVAGLCGALLAGLVGITATAKEVQDAADVANEKAGFQHDDTLDDTFTKDLARDVNARFNGNCAQMFIDKEGNLGSWGRVVRDEIREKKKQFVENEPPDVMELCPNYKYFSKEEGGKREQFWIHTFMSLASPESSCNQAAANHGAPNGTAKGLFQLEARVCDAMQVTGNLYDGQKNTRCAVRLLGAELARRDNLMSPTSRDRDSRRTYWGPLRTDDHNKARGGDIQGAKKFRALVAKFPGCGR